jgi:pantoate--beta-alanine ligase
MKIFHSINEVTQVIKETKKQNKTIGFVPTMGFFHKGHISLFKCSQQKTDISIVSLFVNPTQFLPNEDYDKYPRDITRDMEIATSNNIDYLFIPTISEIYPSDFISSIKLKKITDVFEGKLRQGHFEGVALVLVKLFNIIKPDYAFFGQKDYQQTIVAKQIAKDFNIDTNIVVCPTIRLDTGLALSSRNSYLTEIEFNKANIIFEAMEDAKRMIMDGERNRKIINKFMQQTLNTEPQIKIDYASIAMADDLSEPENFNSNDEAVILIAIYLGKTRLIDNLLITFP